MFAGEPHVLSVTGPGESLRLSSGAGARVFVEVGPKKALQGFVDDVLGDKEGVVSLFTNHPKTGDVASLNQALCGGKCVDLGSDPNNCGMCGVVCGGGVVCAGIAEAVCVWTAGSVPAARAGVAPAIAAPTPSRMRLRRIMLIARVNASVDGNRTVRQISAAGRVISDCCACSQAARCPR